MEYSSRRGMDLRRMQMFPPSNSGNHNKPLSAACVNPQMNSQCSPKVNPQNNSQNSSSNSSPINSPINVQSGNNKGGNQAYIVSEQLSQTQTSEKFQTQMLHPNLSNPTCSSQINQTAMPCTGGMPNHTASGFRPLEQSDNFTVGMAYVPMQRWEQTYDLATARKRGTLFPSLDLPFVMGRCR